MERRTTITAKNWPKDTIRVNTDVYGTAYINVTIAGTYAGMLIFTDAERKALRKALKKALS